MTGNIQGVNVLIGGDITGLTNALKRGGQQLGVFGKRVSTMGRSITAAGRTMFVGLSLPIIGAVGASIKAYSNFDKAMTNSLSIMSGVNGAMRKQMESLAITMSNNSTSSATELAEAYYYLASSGLNAKQSMESLSTVAQFAVAGQMQLKEATELLSDAQNALGLRFKDSEKNARAMQHVSDTIVKAATIANMSVKQFTESLSTDTAGVLSSLNLKLNDGMAILAAYGSVAKKSSEAGNMFGRAVRLMAAGAVKHADAWEKMNIKMFNSNGKMRDLTDIFANMSVELGKLSDKDKLKALSEMGLKNLSQKAITILLNQTNAMKKYRKELKKVNGFTNQVFGKQMDSFAAKTKKFWNQLTNAAIKFGEAVAPALVWVMGKMSKLIAVFQNMSGSMKVFIITMAGSLAVFPLIVIGIGTVVTAIGWLISSIAFLYGTALPAVASVALPVLVAITTVLAGIYLTTGLINDHFYDMTDVVTFMEDPFNTIVGVIGVMLDRLQMIVSIINVIWKTAKVAIVSVGVFMVSMFSNAFTRLENRVFNIIKLFKNAWKILKNPMGSYNNPRAGLFDGMRDSNYGTEDSLKLAGLAGEEAQKELSSAIADLTNAQNGKNLWGDKFISVAQDMKKSFDKGLKFDFKSLDKLKIKQPKFDWGKSPFSDLLDDKNKDGANKKATEHVGQNMLLVGTVEAYIASLTAKTKAKDILARERKQREIKQLKATEDNRDYNKQILQAVKKSTDAYQIYPSF